MLKKNNTSILNKIWVAPMAGVSDSPFRVINRRFGAKNLITEMLSVEGFVREHPRTLDLLNVLEEDKFNLSLQLFGARAEAFYESVLKIGKGYSYINEVNINSGCPVKKVVKHGAGAWLLKDTANLKQILKATRRGVDELKRNGINLKFSLKIRSGWDEKNFLEVAKIAEAEGVEKLILHARTAKMMYTGFADYDDIKELKASIKIPVIANGDIHTIEQGENVLAYTKADEFMVGRILVGNPWFFKNIKKTELKLSEIKKTVLEHIDLSVKFYGKDIAYRLLKKHLIYYVKGNSLNTTVEAKGSRKEYFNSISLTKSLEEQVELVNNYFR